jgi:hypothetical protein
MNMKQVKIYSTQAECYPDVHEFYSVLFKQTDIRIAPNVKQDTQGYGCYVDFIVHERFFDALSNDAIKQAIDGVVDGSDLNEFMIVETYEFPEYWYETNPKANPTSVENIRKFYQCVDKSYFCKLYDDVYDVIEAGVMRV